MVAYRIKIDEALDWELHGETLRQALTDQADKEFQEAEIEVSYIIRISIDRNTDEFVCIPVHEEE